MDALHLGYAIAIRPDIFVSSNQQQIEAARNEGPKARRPGITHSVLPTPTVFLKHCCRHRVV